MLEKKEELEKALEAAERASRAKNEFLSRMSHDMRTPMNAIVGLISLTLDDAHNPEAVKEYMTRMRSVSDFMLSLINDMLDMSGLEDGGVVLKPEPYHFQEFLMNMETMFSGPCRQKNITMCFPEKRSAVCFLADKERVNQIFFHILSNAVKYTPEGGHVSFSVCQQKQVPGVWNCEYIIKDTGVGMTDQFQQHMFEPFVQEDDSITSNLQGSGLGLSITKLLVERMGGTISIQSEKNKGTEVHVRLAFPLWEEKSEYTLERQETSTDSSLNGRTVLLVEDHPLNAQITKRLLERRGVHVISAENGRVGVEKFAASLEHSFDAILMDIRMPEMSGLDASRAIRQLKRSDAGQIPIIAMSANAYQQDVEQSLAAGMNAHLAKPVQPEQLCQTLQHYIQPFPIETVN